MNNGGQTIGPEEKTPGSLKRGVKVGQQFTFWVDFINQAQAEATVMLNPKVVEARTTWTFDPNYPINYDEIEVVLKSE